jgi:hypothetical protein
LWWERVQQRKNGKKGVAVDVEEENADNQRMGRQMAL